MASLLLRVDPTAATPLHEQIFAGLRTRILAGELPCGLRLPSSRQLAGELGVARTTVLQALDALVAEGYLVARPGSGTRVAPELPLSPEIGRSPRRSSRLLPPRLSTTARALLAAPSGAPRLGGAPRAFRPGVPALDAFPTALWARIVTRCHARASSALLDGGESAGHGPLRRAIAAHVSHARGVACTAEQIFVTAGTQPAFDEILRLVVEPGDAVWVENPGYFGARRAVAAARALPVPVPVDCHGLDVAAGVAAAAHARAVLLTPSHHYPLGVTLSLPRRLELLRWATRARATLIEDDYDSEFRHRGRPLTALQGLDGAGCVVYVGTFSKTLFPGLRLGFFVAPPQLVDACAAARAGGGAAVSALEQAALAQFIEDGHFATHLRRMRALYRERSEALLAALHADCAGALEPQPADTGMQLWASLRRPLGDRALRDAAAEQGVEVAALSDYFLRNDRRARGIVFGFGGVGPAAIRAGTRALARAIESETRRRRSCSSPERGLVPEQRGGPVSRSCRCW